jgi:hypothetical protein
LLKLLKMDGLEIIEQNINFKGLINSIDIKPDDFLLPLHEVIVNSIQSIEDRVNPSEKGSIIIRIHRNFQEELQLEEGQEKYNPI